MDIQKEFGKKIRELRLKKGLSQEALANEAELDRTYIPSIEKGKRNVSVLVAYKLSMALKVDICELFSFTKVHKQ